MNDDELIEAMLVAMYDDGCPGAVDSMRHVLAVVRAHDRDATRCPNCDHSRLQLGELRAELATLRAERDGIIAAYKAYMAENRPSRQLYEQHTTELRERAEKAEANYRFMVERAADEKLDGYRELGSKCAALEERAEKAEAAAKRGFHKLVLGASDDPAG